MNETIHAPEAAGALATAPDAPRAADARGRLALTAAGAALGVGALCDALLRADHLGLNVPIIAAALVAAALLLLRARDGAIPRESIGAGAAALLFAAMFAWRESGMLALLNLFALATAFALLALAAPRAPLANLRFGTPGEYVLAWLRSAGDAAVGAVPLLVKDVDFGAVTSRLHGNRLQRIAVGVLLAIPLLAVFGALFAEADAVFGELLGRFLAFDVDRLLGHLAVTAIFSWLAAGWLRGVAVARRDPALPDGPGRIALGATEIGVALGLLDALFALFVGVQLRYFFGGDALVQRTAGMTYAEYARHGFFELCWASALVLPVLLASRALLRAERPRDVRVHRLLSLVLVGLVGVVMLSALARLRLYVGTYGWTEDRLFAIAGVGWLATVFAWYVATALRGRVRGFAFGAVASAALVLLQLNLFDPDAFIVRQNREMHLAGKRALDPEYGWRSLSADAVPASLASLPLLPPQAQCSAAESLVERWGVPATDWRAWSLARARARAAVREARPALDAIARSPLCAEARAQRRSRPGAPPAPATPAP